MTKHATHPHFNTPHTIWTAEPEAITNNTRFLCSSITWSKVDARAHRVASQEMNESEWLGWLKEEFDTHNKRDAFSPFHRCEVVRLARRLKCFHVAQWCIQTWGIEEPKK
jgi:hypothetical protein